MLPRLFAFRRLSFVKFVSAFAQIDSFVGF